MNVAWDGITADGFAVADIHVPAGHTIDLEGPWVRITYNGPDTTGLVRLYRDLNPGMHHRVWISTYADRDPSARHKTHWTIISTARNR
jgi:hypothetical protein